MTLRPSALTVLLVVTLAAGLGGCAGVIVGGAATGAAVANDPRTTGTVIEDQSIELKVMKALGDDEEIKAQAHYSATSYNQIVLLTGQAPTQAIRARIETLTRGIEKVRLVHNEITIAAPSSMVARTNDTLLTTKVKTKLFTEDQLNAGRIKVVSEAGVVYLMGLVSESEGDLAADIASRTSGVQKVVKLFE